MKKPVNAVLTGFFYVFKVQPELQPQGLNMSFP